MANSKNHLSIEVSSEKSFGVVFFVFFFCIAMFPLTYSNQINLPALFLSIIFLVLGLRFPKVLILPNIIWFKFGIMLGRLVTPIILAFVYYFVVYPTGLLMRLSGKDILMHKIDKKMNSYWIERKERAGSMKNQF